MKKTICYTDEGQDFAGTNIAQKPLPPDHKYFHGPVWRAVAWAIYYLVAAPVAFVIQKCWYREKVIGKEKLKPYKKKGFFLYGNHTRLMGDVFCPPMICFSKKVYVLANPDSVSIPVLGNFPEMLGCVPLPTDRKGVKNFHEALLRHAEQGHVISIYPEAKIWPYYTKIRPFPNGSFRYPAETGKPVFCMTVTHQKGRFFKRPKSVTYIDGPFSPDETLDRKQNQANLYAAVTECMHRRSQESTYEYIRYIKQEPTDNNEKTRL